MIDKASLRNVNRIVLSFMLAFLVIMLFYIIEERFVYARLEVYLTEHHITENIRLSCANGINIVLNETDDPVLYRVCLPGNEKGKECRLDFTLFKTLVIGDKVFRSGDDIGDCISTFEGEPQSMKIYAPRGELLYDGWIEFFFLDENPIMMITTSENAISIVDQTEAGAVKPHIDSFVSIIEKDGKKKLIIDAELFRHGNSTFDNYDPKSYNLNLNQPDSILEMTPGRKWVLKANSMDKTQIIRNETAFKAARMAGLSNTPESRYVNLYINGKYYGLYLLSQRINGSEMMKLSQNEYLLEMDHRYSDERYYFMCDDMGVVVHYPYEVTEEELERLTDRYYEAKNSIIENGDYERYIDVESFVKMYVLQDFFVQTDIDFSSFFFTFEKDGKFHAGPVWDFDLSCGLTSSLPYHEGLAERARLFEPVEKKCIFLNYLGHNEEFMAKVRDYYLNDFQYEISSYLEDGWDKDMLEIAGALYTGSILNETGDKGRKAMDSENGIKDWITRRNRYLISYYENIDDYACVRFNFAWGGMTAAVRKNEPIGFMPDDGHEGNDDAFWGEITGFTDAAGNKVDDDLIIDKDTELYAVYTEDSYAWEEYSLP